MKSMAMAVVLVCAMATSAWAGDLGERGAMSINGAFALDLSSHSNDQNDNTVTSITVAPNGDLFVIPNVSLGGGLIVRYNKSGNVSTTSYGAQGRAGYYLPIGSAGIWLMAGFAYLHGDSSIDTVLGTTGGTSDTFTLQVFMPLVVHLAPGFFIGLGPAISQDLVYSDNDNTQPDAKQRVLGITSIVGGAW